MSECPPSYGDVTGEYLALRRAAGLVEHTHDLVVVAGPDATPFVQGLVSQDIEGLGAGEVARSLLLGPEGKLRAMLWMLGGQDEVLILTDAGQGPATAEDLERYRFRVKAEVSAAPGPVHSLCGPESAEILSGLGLTVPAGWGRDDGALVASIPLGGLPRFAVYGIDAGGLVGAGAQPAGSLAATAVRVEAGEPRMGLDVDEKTIPQETGLVPLSVSFTKGCYLGQELVARIDSRGHVNRILRGVTIGENVLPPEGAEVVAGDKVVGTLSSVAESLSLRAPIALAMVRREVEPPSEVTVRWEGRSVPAAVLSLPLSDFTDS